MAQEILGDGFFCYICKDLESAICPAPFLSVRRLYNGVGEGVDLFSFHLCFPPVEMTTTVSQFHWSHSYFVIYFYNLYISYFKTPTTFLKLANIARRQLSRPSLDICILMDLPRFQLPLNYQIRNLVYLPQFVHHMVNLYLNVYEII